ERRVDAILRHERPPGPLLIGPRMRGPAELHPVHVGHPRPAHRPVRRGRHALVVLARAPARVVLVQPRGPAERPLHERRDRRAREPAGSRAPPRLQPGRRRDRVLQRGTLLLRGSLLLSGALLPCGTLLRGALPESLLPLRGLLLLLLELQRLAQEGLAPAVL